MERKHVDVAFGVPKGRSGLLTWGQQRVVELMAGLRPNHASLNLRFVWRVRPGTATEDVTAAIREMMEACESVRTLFDLDAPAEQQRVVAQGHLRVPVVTVGAATYSTAADAAEELGASEFGPEELPIRLSIMADRDGPAYLLFAVSHLASDYLGVQRLLWHLRDVLDFTAHPDVGDLETAHPLDISEWEGGDAARREGARALARHERSFQQMPQSMMPRLPVPPLNPRYQYVEIQTTAGAWCLSRLAERHAVSETAIAHAVLSLVLSYVSNLQRAHLQVCLANRFDRAFAGAVASVTQDVPTCVTVDDSDVDTLLRRSAAAMRWATMTGRFPHNDFTAACKRVENERGQPLDLSFWLNSRLLTPASAEEPTGRRLKEELARTTVRWTGGDQCSTSTLFAYVDRDEDTLTVRTLVDTAYVTRDEAEQWLWAFESILVTAVLRPELGTRDLAANAGLVPFEATADWAQIDHSWIHLPTTTARLREVIPDASLRLAVRTADETTSLVALVSAPPSRQDPGGLIDSGIVEALRGCKVAMRPHRFVLDTGE